MSSFTDAASFTLTPASYADTGDPDALIVTIGPYTFNVWRQEVATIMAGWGDNAYLVKAQIAQALQEAGFTPTTALTATAAQIAAATPNIKYPQ